MISQDAPIEVGWEKACCTKLCNNNKELDVTQLFSGYFNTLKTTIVVHSLFCIPEAVTGFVPSMIYDLYMCGMSSASTQIMTLLYLETIMCLLSGEQVH